MLRLTFSQSDGREQWNLCGQLAGPWVDELRAVWRRIRVQAPAAAAVVDLRQVTCIDEAGEHLLAEMQSSGADFVATGVEHRHLLANLRGGDAGAVRRNLKHLCGGRP